MPVIEKGKENKMTDAELKNDLRKQLTDLFKQAEGNILPEAENIAPECRGLRIFEEPLIGFGSAQDPLFEEYRKPGVIGPWYRTPKDWMPEAETVISLFFPFTEEVRSSNRAQKEHCSVEWAHARVDGQEFQDEFMRSAARFFEKQGFKVLVPGQSPLFGQVSAGKPSKLNYQGEIPSDAFGSNWSERHAAFVCGLGTFGLSKGLITEKGIAGRFSSILISKKIEADNRPYTEIYEYCTRCGACAVRCPLNAITIEKGKNHMICSAYRTISSELYSPRFGCGLCQTAVPCEHKRP